MKQLANYVNCADYLKDAQKIFEQQNLSHHWRYIQGTSGDGISYRKNQQHFDDIELMPSMLHGGEAIELSTQLLDKTIACPLILAPIAYQQLAHSGGELASFQAAQAQDVGFCLSTLSTFDMESVASLAEGPQSTRIFQLYMQADNEVNLDLVSRAKEAGYSAIMITIDAPINGLRYHEARDQFSLPREIVAQNLVPYHGSFTSGLGHNNDIDSLMLQAPTWQQVAALIEQISLPVILKGVINVDDAYRAREIGAQGIVVSNHGGRVLDGVPSSISQLAKMRDALGSDYTILFDSGIRRGSDIYKALALGANAVLIGRPFMHGLAVAGALGVAHTLRLLKDELKLTMALMGNANIASISSRQVLTPWHSIA